jgi:hypothetical protein
VDKAVHIKVIKEPQNIKKNHSGIMASADGAFYLMYKAYCGIYCAVVVLQTKLVIGEEREEIDI